MFSPHRCVYARYLDAATCPTDTETCVVCYARVTGGGYSRNTKVANMAGCLRALRLGAGFPAFKVTHSAPKALPTSQTQTLWCCWCRALSLTSAHRSYDEVFRDSIERPDDFWAQAADQLVWHKKWNKVLDNCNAPFTRWFVCKKGFRH